MPSLSRLLVPQKPLLEMVEILIGNDSVPVRNWSFANFRIRLLFNHKEHKDHEEKLKKTLRDLRLCGEISCVLLKKAKLQ